MDVTRCARILWAATAGMSAATGAPDELSKARLALAQMLMAGHTAGFPEPIEPSSAERQTPGWIACVEAAVGAAIPPGAGAQPAPVPIAALLWANDGRAPAEPAAGHGLAWPATSTISRRIGPARSDRDDVWLFLYDGIDETTALAKDGDAAPGLFPRAAVAAVAVVPADAIAELRAARVAAVRPWAIFLFVVSVVLAIATNVWIYGAADLAARAAASVDAREDAGACLAEVTRRAGSPAPETLTHDCDRIWRTAWAAQDTAIASERGWWPRTLHRLWRLTDVAGQLSLLGPLLLSALAILALIVAAGLAMQGLFFGALIDERNRLSLSRAQQLAWTIVLLGGYSVLAVFNVALLAAHLRDLGQGAAVSSAAQAIPSLFPSMDATLWAVLGITVAISPYLSRRILPFQAIDAAGAAAGQEVEVIRPAPSQQLDTNAIASEAKWTDLFQGERVGDADHVDVSRLQHLVITGLLLASYIVLLVQYARAIDGTAVLLALRTGAPVFAGMPPVDATFVGLLTLSHAAYLGFKTLPGAAGGGAGKS